MQLSAYAKLIPLIIRLSAYAKLIAGCEYCEAGTHLTKARLRCLSLATVLSDQNTVAKYRRLQSTFL